MNKYCKNETYKLLFDKIYTRYYAPNDENSTKFEEKINFIDKNLKSLLSHVYDDIQEKEEIKSNNIIDTKLINFYKEKLASIEQEIKKILIDNFKIKPSDDLDISRKSSDVIIIEKHEAYENFGKNHNGLNLHNIHNHHNIQDILNQNDELYIFSDIFKNLKKLREVSKPPDNSGKIIFNILNIQFNLVNLDISCTSMINSIYISNFQESKKSEVEKFYMQHEDKLYFFDALFEFMNNFINTKKLSYSISKDKPQTLGILIESILKDWLKCRTLSEKYKMKLKQLISVNKI
jgi:hypothetical protein